MISLNDDLIVGKGAHRTCYRHPEAHNLCIKVSREGFSQEQDQELAYYKRLSNRNIQWQLLARYHGTVHTNIGTGYVFDLVIDANNQPAKTLEHYLNQPNSEALAEPLLNLKDYLLHNLVITKEIKPRNIACVNNNGTIERCVVVDDIGNTEFFPISNYVSSSAKRKINRKWQRFEASLNELGLSLN
ncbi:MULTISPECIES: YrbL family protein [unclassified Pseudoalteromonas]|uniref:YrbL family protein n=1 Tax=Pseudoalteromonas TaxID=53246 RepID=UPI0014865751|nr:MULTISPECIES: YrbL family protein [unclassified Pseudoalteromonas]